MRILCYVFQNQKRSLFLHLKIPHIFEKGNEKELYLKILLLKFWLFYHTPYRRPYKVKFCYYDKLAMTNSCKNKCQFRKISYTLYFGWSLSAWENRLSLALSPAKLWKNFYLSVLSERLTSQIYSEKNVVRRSVKFCFVVRLHSNLYRNALQKDFYRISPVV